MLQRVLEPELMDTPDEAQAYDASDKPTVHRQFVDDLLAAGLFDGWSEEDFEERDPLRVLDLGTGPARIPIELCRRTQNVRVMAMDGSVSMLQLARMNTELSSMTHQVQLDQTDANQMHYSDEMFDAVISNSLLHHVPDPSRVLSEIVRVLQPGGLIFIRDLLRPETEAEVARLVELHASSESDSEQQSQELYRTLFEASLRAALSFEEIRSAIAALGVPPETVQATSDRHWTWVVRK
ncbi:MAG: class I SAM-dependent methyltransferase [Planctomycetota bacterium]|nr:class I SAM-dependent methyltransferase [Planctomycetota bacterium]